MPISLYVSIEVTRIIQAAFINHDVELYHEETNKPTRARTSNLNEELGMVSERGSPYVVFFMKE